MQFNLLGKKKKVKTGFLQIRIVLITAALPFTGPYYCAKHYAMTFFFSAYSSSMSSYYCH